MEETIVLAMILCVGLTIIGYVMKMWPVTFISSLGWAIVSIQIFQDTGDYLILGLMVTLAIAQIVMVRDAEGD